MEEGLLSASSDEVTKGTSSVTPVVLLSTIVAAFGTLAYGFVAGYCSPAESGIMDDIGLSIAEYSAFGSILTIGGMMGALIAGRISDIFGRRLTMWLSEVFFIFGWISIIFAKNIWWLDIGRVSMGIGAGLNCFVTPVYIAEITPKNIRGGFIAIVALTTACGVGMMFIVGNFMAWRMLALVGMIPCLVQIFGIFFIPESPRWLAVIGQEKGLEATLCYLRGKNIDISSEIAAIKDYTAAILQQPQSRFRDLFERKYAHQLIISLGLMILVQLSGVNAFASFANSIFEAAGCSVGIASTLMAILQLPFGALSIILMDRLGRRLLLMFTAAGACLGCFMVGLGFFLKDFHQWKEFSPSFALTGSLVYSASFSAGLGGTPWVLMSEIFPINIKGTAGTLVTLGNWFSSWIVTYAFNFLFTWSSSGIFFLFAVVCGLTVIFVANLVPETKGRTLEEIQASMELFK